MTEPVLIRRCECGSTMTSDPADHTRWNCRSCAAVVTFENRFDPTEVLAEMRAELEGT